MLAKKEIKSTCSILITSKVTEVQDLGEITVKSCISYVSGLLFSSLCYFIEREEENTEYTRYQFIEWGG